MFKYKSVQGYLMGALLGAIIGSIFFFVQPVNWKGQALIRIGQISSLSQSQVQTQGQAQNSFPIEPLPTVVERVKSRTFVHAVEIRAKREEIEALLNIDQKAGMTAKQTRNGDSLEITIVGNSFELVKASTDAVAAELISQHDVLFKDFLADSSSELAKTESEISELTKRINTATEKLSKENSALAALLIISTQPALEFKLNRVSMLREAVSSSNIRRTALVDAPSIIERRLFNSLLRAGLFGLLLGIFFTAAWFRFKR